MKPPKTIKYRDFKALFRKYGITISPGTKHPIMRRGKDKHPVPNFGPNDDVEKCYVTSARRKFKLMPEDGVSHRDFYKR